MKYLYHMFASYYAKGGLLMVPIFLVSLVAWFMAVEKLVGLNRFGRARKNFLKQVASLKSGTASFMPTGKASYDSLLSEMTACRSDSHEGCSFTLLFREFLIAAVPDLERGFGTLKIWISVAPLLGLLGTVNGMIKTFQIITDFGFGNPSLMAEGISVALITPQAGLTVAFPLMMLHTYLVNRSHSTKVSLLMDGEELVRDFGSPTERRKLTGTAGD